MVSSGGGLHSLNIFYRVKNPPLKFSEIFPQRLKIFKQNFACLLCVEIYDKYKILFNYLYI